MLVHGDGVWRQIPGPTVDVGSGEGDDLIVADWPPGALRVHPVQAHPVVEIRTPGVALAGRALEPGELVNARHGSELRWRDRTLRFVALAHFSGDQNHTLYLAERRCALVAALLERPGDLVPDDELLSQVWPRDASKSRLHLNTLVFRVRNDLVKAGIDGASLIERDAGGSRFQVARGADVSVHID